VCRIKPGGLDHDVAEPGELALSAVDKKARKGIDDVAAVRFQAGIELRSSAF
jgi:hypothetical protein